MQFESKLTMQDWRAFNAFLCKEKRNEKPVRAFIKNVAIWACIGFVAFYISGELSPKTKSFLFGAYAGLVLLLVYGHLYRTRVIRRLQPRENGYLLSTHSFAVDENGVNVSGAVARTAYSWSAFESGNVSGELLMLFLDNSIALLISLREVDREPLFQQIEKFTNFKIERGDPRP